LTLDEASARTGLDSRALAHALATYVRSILSGNTAYDRYVNGDVNALTPRQKAGLQLFRGKGNCTACHVGPNLTDERVHNTGVAWRDGRLTDAGAGRGDFKTPTLREVARTGPYMHDGALATLEEVVDFYSDGGRPNPSLDPEIRPLKLTTDEKQSLAAFLRALTGTVTEGR
jgi:cytochrome c peroxidase